MAKLILFILPLLSILNVTHAAYPNIFASAAPAEVDPRPIHPSLLEEMGRPIIRDEDDGTTTSGPQDKMMANDDVGERSVGGTTDRCSTATGFDSTTDDAACFQYVGSPSKFIMNCLPET